MNEEQRAFLACVGFAIIVTAAVVGCALIWPPLVLLPALVLFGGAFVALGVGAVVMAMKETDVPDEVIVYDRDELVAICEAAIVPMDRWHDRDSAHSQEGVGKAWVLLKAGAPFTIHTKSENGDHCVTDDRTIWLTIEWTGFDVFEWGRDDGQWDSDTFYLPTRKRLEEAAGGDWYW